MTFSVFHRAAGLTIAADRSIPGLPAGCGGDVPDVLLHVGTPPPWPFEGASRRLFTAEHPDDQSRPVVVVSRVRNGFHFRYADETNIWIGDDARHVWCTWPPAATFEDTATYISGPILGFILRLKGALALHASAVQIGDGALVLVGSHGAGKSTAAAALGRRGCAVVSDDVLHVRQSNGKWVAEPFAALLRLWESGAALALGASIELPRLTPTWDKRSLEMDTQGVASVRSATPVAGVVFLDPREPAVNAPRLDSITPAEALVRLAANGSAAHLLDERARAAEFTLLDVFVRDIPCTRATAAETAEHFDAFIDLLQAWAVQRSPAHAR